MSSDTPDGQNKNGWRMPATLKEFLLALGEAHTYSVRRNVYVLFGFLWGLPIPFFSVGIDLMASGLAPTFSECWQVFVRHPIHFMFALHPFIFAVLFGAMGTIRHRKEAKIQELLKQLQHHIDELATANKKLEELDRLKRDFTANVTHELKTPLITIQGYNESIVEGRFGPLSDKQREGLKVALRNIDRLCTLIDELLELSRLDSGKMKLNKVVFNIETAIAMVLKNFEPQAKLKNLRFESQMPGTAVHVYADPEKIQRVLSNLVSNSVKFTPEGGQIGVTLQALSTGQVLVTVWDTGIGIPEHLRSHLFERFWQADTSKKHRGTGLGLAIVKGILDSHGSSVRVHSRAGQGSQFTFDLPSLESVVTFYTETKEIQKVS